MRLQVFTLLFVTPFAAFGADAPVTVAVFQGAGVRSSAEKLIAAMKLAEGRPIDVRRITADEIRDGKLAGVHVLMQPGGSEYGSGRVFCFSPHPELTEGLHDWIPLARREWLVPAPH